MCVCVSELGVMWFFKHCEYQALAPIRLGVVVLYCKNNGTRPPGSMADRNNLTCVPLQNFHNDQSLPARESILAVELEKQIIFPLDRELVIQAIYV